MTQHSLLHENSGIGRLIGKHDVTPPPQKKEKNEKKTNIN